MRMIAAAALAACATLAASASARPVSTCSAARLSASLPYEKLPAVVSVTRQGISNAAVSCDYARLEHIGRERGGFVFRAGGGGSAAAYWRDQEARGTRPLAMLMRALASKPTRTSTGDYVWRGPNGWRTAISRSGDWQLFLRTT